MNCGFMGFVVPKTEYEYCPITCECKNEKQINDTNYKPILLTTDKYLNQSYTCNLNQNCSYVKALDRLAKIDNRTNHIVNLLDTTKST